MNDLNQTSTLEQAARMLRKYHRMCIEVGRGDSYWLQEILDTEAALRDGQAEPEFYTVFAEHNGGWIPLPGYSNETVKGVKDLVLTAARREGYKGTIEGRLMSLGWRIGPVYADPTPSAPTAVEPDERAEYVPCPTCAKNTASDDPRQWCPCAPRASKGAPK